MPKRRRDRERSKTPEVPWAELPLNPELETQASERRPAKPAATEKSQSQRKASAEAPGEAAPALVAGQKEAIEAERKAWRCLVVLLAALRGHKDVEAILEAQHPELRRTAESCGADGHKTLTLEAAKDLAKEWFARGLRGSNRHGAAERASLCRRLAESLQRHAAALARAPVEEAANALEDGDLAEEGPRVCCALASELKGSRYEGLWISRAAPGVYLLGDDPAEGSGLPAHDADGATIHSPVRAVVKCRKGRLVVDAFYNQGEKGELNPAGVSIGPFLSVYYEGIGLREALAQWKQGANGNGGDARPKATAAGGPAATGAGSGSDSAASIAKINATLPPGWELRESRSKKGVFYYANEAKGLAQLERPKG